MSKPKAPENTNPICCGERSTYINYGKYLEYFYCKKCKKEVAAPSKWGGVETDQSSPLYAAIVASRTKAYSGGVSTPTVALPRQQSGVNTLLPPTTSTYIPVPTKLLRNEVGLDGRFPCHDDYHYLDMQNSAKECTCGKRWF